MLSKFSHVDLVVSSIERSLPFYRDLLTPIGWSGLRQLEGERGEPIWYLSVEGTGGSNLGSAMQARSPHQVCLVN
jgi:catechol 2,3-dioxygenase-like lactoylglutathione lyase family enzyme